MTTWYGEIIEVVGGVIRSRSILCRGMINSDTQENLHTEIEGHSDQK